MEFKVKEIRYHKRIGNRVERIPAAIIVVEDSKTGNQSPHVITHFLYKTYHKNAGSINTELAPARNIVQFLNYILMKKETDNAFDDVKGLTDLNINHANSYLEYCVEEKKNLNNTLEIKEMYLSEFYKYLDDEKILKESPTFIPNITTTYKGYTRTSYRLDFMYRKTDEKFLYRKIKRKDMVPKNYMNNYNRQEIRLKYIYEFLLIALKEKPEISFAVALQIFAGLRMGEVVNLMKSSLLSQNNKKYGEDGLIILVRDNQDILFPRLKNLATVAVKKPRDQACLSNKLLSYCYKNHINNIIPKLQKGNKSDILFFDIDGNAMSGDTYENRFNELKDIYKGYLLGTNGRYEDYREFSETRWGTHICRGIFTNFCHDAGFSVEQTAILRGDSNTHSMSSYFDVLSATYNISKAINIIMPHIENDEFSVFSSDYKKIITY
ncbi:hypothetical protein CLPUN_26980 [Clostridium puniceum]|uniref:Phage integrase family protein n=1 Tax=Clostridium puniceum TaxID=29367 RepID=A0A1S8TFL4_9CLOT|nr:hypothetical protein [Clostridium puniceum]OOM76466.1 hypothetical protein CLPUN_26980 [Clostridium puniceum]